MKKTNENSNIFNIMDEVILVPFVNSLIVLNGEGERIIAKYYDGKSNVEQINFEAALFKKASKVMSPSSEGDRTCIGMIIFVMNALVVLGEVLSYHTSSSEEELVVFQKVGGECFISVAGSNKEVQCFDERYFYS